MKPQTSALRDAIGKIVWSPIPDTSQEIALDSRADETLFCGTRGPGKTDTQLMKFRRYVGLGYGKFWRGIILDREYKNLDDIITKSKRWFAEFGDGATFLAATNQLKWVWPTGEELLFRVAKKADDYNDYHGHEYPFIGWNELTKYPDRTLYDRFMSCNRSSFTPEKDSPKDKDGNPTLGKIPLIVFSTTNPWGPGMNWVKAQFIDPAPYGVVVRRSVRVIDPQSPTKEEVEVQKTQVAIFGSYLENIYLDAKYIATLASETDPNLRKAWLEGSWDIAAGGALADVWNARIHIVPRFKVPTNWRVDCSFDWGSTHPFWVGWWAEANGEEVTVIDATGQPRTFCPSPKSFILIHELYGSEQYISGRPDRVNVGVKWSVAKIATEMHRIEKMLRDEGWIVGKVYRGPADNQIFAQNQSDEETIDRKFAAKKIQWGRSNKSKGSRINGLQTMRDRLEASLENTGPGLYTMVHNRASIAILPNLPRDEDNPDDVDTNAEDHPYDGWRYKVLDAAKRFATSVVVRFANAG